MTSLAQARKAWQSSKRQFKEERPTRTVYLGKGTGYTVDDMIPTGSPNYFYARPSLANDNWIIVKNTGAAGAPVFNMPVLVGYTELDKKNESIIGVDHSSLEWQSSSGAQIGVHAPQHGINGADTLFVDSRMFTPGLPRPQSSNSMVVYVSPMSYVYDKLYQFAGASTPDLSAYVPENGQRYVTIAIDARSGALVVHPGDIMGESSTGGTPSCTPDEWLSGQCGSAAGGGGWLSPPQAGAEEIPLAAVYMTSDTSVLEWRDDGIVAKNMYDIRPLLAPPMGRLFDFMQASGASQTLPSTGAQQPVSPYITGNILDNDLYLGDNVTGKLGYGKKLWFQGIDKGTDLIWGAKYSDAYDINTLRIHVGDNPNHKDGFELGTAPATGELKLWTTYFGAYADKTFTFGSPTTSLVGLNVDGVVATSEGVVSTRTDLIETEGSYVMGASDTCVFVTMTTGSAVHIELPAASVVHTNLLQPFTIKNNYQSTVAISVSPSTLDSTTVEGASQVDIAIGESLTLFTNGTNWHTI